MKSTRARSFMVLIMTLVFFAGLAYYTVKLIMHSAEWASMPMNAHISDTDGLAFAGNIYDRNNVILAQSIDKKRVCISSEIIQRIYLQPFRLYTARSLQTLILYTVLARPIC